jgi:hypothetical protein
MEMNLLDTIVILLGLQCVLQFSLFIFLVILVVHLKRESGGKKVKPKFKQTEEFRLWVR